MDHVYLTTWVEAKHAAIAGGTDLPDSTAVFFKSEPCRFRQLDVQTTQDIRVWRDLSTTEGYLRLSYATGDLYVDKT